LKVQFAKNAKDKQEKQEIEYWDFDMVSDDCDDWDFSSSDNMLSKNEEIKSQFEKEKEEIERNYHQHVEQLMQELRQHEIEEVSDDEYSENFEEYSDSELT